METEQRVYWHKRALLLHLQVEQLRKQVKMALRWHVDVPKINGYKLPRG